MISKLADCSAVTFAGLLAVLAVLWLAQRSSSAQSDSREHGRIDVDILVDAPRADVWRAWTTSEGAQEFFAPEAEIELFPGGAYNMLFMPDNPPGSRGAENQKVLSFLPMEMLSFEWGAPPQFPFARAHPAWVVLQFTKVNEQQTHVRLVHTGFEELKLRHPEHVSEFDQAREYFGAAWPKVLGWLKRRFDEGPRWDADGTELWVH